MLLYADEDFDLPVVTYLRAWGHDVITAQEDGRCAAPDADILTRADALSRAVLTFNRRHFERLHFQGHTHHGILSPTRDNDFQALATRIDTALTGLAPGRWCFRVNKPPKP